jgi:hypothetical protein
VSESPSTVEAGTGEPYRGPVGETRKLWLVIVLWIVTLGIYGWYWFYKQHKEVQDYAGLGVGGGVGLVFAILLTIVNCFLLPSEVGQMQTRDGDAKTVSGWTGLWVLIPIAGFFIWIIELQDTLNRFWESKGAPAA